MMKTEFEVVSIETMEERFNIKQYDPLFRPNYACGILFKGDVSIECNMDEKWLENLKDQLGIGGVQNVLLVFEENLSINGDIEFYEDYPCVLVLKNLSCEVLHSHDQIIHVVGNANVKYVINGVYNHGVLIIQGVTKVPYVLNSDHHIDIKAENSVKINYFDNYKYDEDYTVDDFPVVFKKEILDPEEGKGLDVSAFISFLKEGKSPFKNIEEK